VEKKRWLTGKKVAGVVFILFMIDASCFGAWWAITHPPEKTILPEGVRIGLPIDSTHYSGKHCLWGAEMAADEINEYGTGGPLEPGEAGVLVGKERLPVVIVPEESQEMSPDVGTERTVAAVTKLITTYKVNVLLGGYATEEALLETASRYETIYIDSSSSEDRITTHIIENPEKYKYVFSMLNNSTQLGRAMVTFFEWLRDTYGFTKTAIIAEEYDWCDPIIKWFKDHTPEGTEIVYEVRFPSTTTTFLPYLTKAKDADAQVLMGIIALDWGITYLKEWQSMKYGLSVGLVLVAERSTCWEETDGGCKYHCEMIGGLPKSNVTDWTYHFYNTFEEKYGEHPMYAAEYSYGAVYTYCQAVERAGTLEPEAVMAELKKTDIILPYCRLRFREQTQCAMGGNNPDELMPDWGQDYWPNIFSEWMSSKYRPAVYSSADPWMNRTVAYANPVMPPDVDPEWVIPGYTPP